MSFTDFCDKDAAESGAEVRKFLESSWKLFFDWNTEIRKMIFSKLYIFQTNNRLYVKIFTPEEKTDRRCL